MSFETSDGRSAGTPGHHEAFSSVAQEIWGPKNQLPIANRSENSAIKVAWDSMTRDEQFTYDHELSKDQQWKTDQMLPDERWDYLHKDQRERDKSDRL